MNLSIKIGGDGTHLKTMNKLSKIQLLILNDLLLTPPGDQERRDLLETVGNRYQSGATVIARVVPHKGLAPQISATRHLPTPFATGFFTMPAR